MFGNLDSKTFAQDLEIAQLIQVEGMAGQDLVVLQRIRERLIDVPVGVFSFDNIQFALNQQDQQEQMDLIGRKTVHGSA